MKKTSITAIAVIIAVFAGAIAQAGSLGNVNRAIAIPGINQPSLQAREAFASQFEEIQRRRQHEEFEAARQTPGTCENHCYGSDHAYDYDYAYYFYGACYNECVHWKVMQDAQDTLHDVEESNSDTLHNINN